MANANETITLTYENILEIARTEARGIYHGDDEEKLATIANRAANILDAIFGDDGGDAPEIPARAARRVVYQAVGIYDDAIYTAQRRTGEILNALRGM